MTDQSAPAEPAPRDLPFTVDLRRIHLAVGWIAFGLPLSLIAVSQLPTVCFHDSIRTTQGLLSLPRIRKNQLFGC